ncbi:hypothetical protein [Ilumatobacter sp.]|uniref:hypothetical protein n=1 Tax=Ilumatobacter sp. TaxID=1967498 RepID=UPI003750F20A
MSTTRTVQSLRGPIDARRTLTPRAYLRHPYLFGEADNAEFNCPNDGDTTSLEIARMLHICVCAWRRSSQSCSGASLARQFGFSRQSWSDVTRGHRWPGHTVLVALLSGLNQAPRSDNAQRPHATQRVTVPGVSHATDHAY